MSESTSTIPPPKQPEPKESTSDAWIRGLQVLGLLFIFLIGIRALGTGFKGLGKPLLDSLFQATDNPFVGLAVGILATTLVQSSSVTTAMVVGLVGASDNALPVENAVPIIMGANIGTTVTNTIVALGHVARRDEFRRAFAAATCHDFFNFLTVAVLLPFELATGFLRQASGVLASYVSSGSGPGRLPNPIKAVTKGAVGQLQQWIEPLSDSSRVQAVILIALAAGLIFGALFMIVRTLRLLAATRLQVYITRSFGKNAYLGIVVGIVVTVMVQSSSITTSVMVPLAAAGIVTLRQVFPVNIGANIGTTITAILASMAAPETTGVQIALVHLLFNVAGTLMIYPWSKTRELPLRLAEWLAEVATRNKKAALLYVIALFYGLPALFILISKSV
jgi:sodium-dependent phosphate cotransporter